MWRKFIFYWYLTRITGVLHKEKYTFLIISLSVFLINISDKCCRENLNKRFIFKSFFFFENRAVLEIMLKNIVDPDRTQMTMRIACWVSKATNTNSQCVILIAFPLQQWLHKLALLFLYTRLPVSLILCCRVFHFITTDDIRQREWIRMVWKYTAYN
jgi:hypothetical protein